MDELNKVREEEGQTQELSPSNSLFLGHVAFLVSIVSKLKDI